MVGSVVGYDLVDPGAELANPSVHGRCTHVAVAAAPGHNTNKHPRVFRLADKRASGVTLRRKKGAVWGVGEVYHGTVQRTGCWCSPGMRRHLSHPHRSWSL